MTRKIGPTPEEYKKAHPWVDWSRHEVYYTMIGSHRGLRGRELIMKVDSHGPKFNYDHLYACLDEDDKVASGTHWRLDNSHDGKVSQHWRSPNYWKPPSWRDDDDDL